MRAYGLPHPPSRPNSCSVEPKLPGRIQPKQQGCFMQNPTSGMVGSVSEVSFELVLYRCVVVAALVASLLPLAPVGAWTVRLFDFPRLQITAILLLVAVVLACRLPVVTTPWEAVPLFLLTAALLIWQGSRIVAYTPLWPHEAAPISGDSREPLAVCVANIQYDNARRDEAIAKLTQADADHLLLIEVNEEWQTGLAPLAEQYPHSVGVVLPDGRGMRLLSRLPIADAQVTYLVSENRPSIHATLQSPDGGRVRFIGLHPTPPGLYSEDDGDRFDSRIRDAELMIVAEQVAKRPDARWLVAGDFNDVAWSHTTRLFKRTSGLLDPRIGRELCSTYHADYWFLRFPIDHVFVSAGARVGSLERFRVPGSDHFAIVARLAYAENPGDEPAPAGDDRSDRRELVREGRQDAEQRRDSVEAQR